MKKTLIAGSCILLAACLVAACGGEGGSGTTKVQAKPAPTGEKIAPPDQKMKDALKSSTTAPPDAPAGKKKTNTGG